MDLDINKISLKDLRIRIEETDLIPSRTSLLTKIADNFSRLQKQGIVLLSDLRKGLGSKKAIGALSEKTGIDTEYLVLLRREIEGYLPKAYPLSSFDMLPEKVIVSLAHAGIKNSVMFFEECDMSSKRNEISKKLGIDKKLMDTLYALVSLTRIQWTSPTFARMLFAAGYDTPKKVSKADADRLYTALDCVNTRQHLFNGKIGLRDVKRLIKAASYIS